MLFSMRAMSHEIRKIDLLGTVESHDILEYPQRNHNNIKTLAGHLEAKYVVFASPYTELLSSLGMRP